LRVTDAEVQAAETAVLSTLKPNSNAEGAPLPPILLGLCPGAEYGPAKRWPVENFAQAVIEVTRRLPNCAWLLLGSDADRVSCERIAQQAPDAVLNLVGKTSLRELLALLKLCRVLLSNDTGPMHAAAALGTPVVVPFGSTSSVLTGPGLPGDPRHRLIQSDVPCSPCFLRECPIDFRCMKSITVAQVADAVVQAVSSPCPA
jgi:heptosyltransferase-2